MSQEDGTEKTYKVQRALLTSASDHFKKALCGGFSESKTNTLRFPDTDAGIIQYFFYFLLHQCVPLGGPVLKLRDADFVHSTIETAIRVWTFADQYLMTQLKNQAMSQLYTLIQHSGIWPKVETLSLAFANCTRGSTLYRFVTAVVLQGIWVSRDLRDQSKQVADKDNITEVEKLGYQASDLASFEAIKGVMSDILGTWVDTGGEDIETEPLASYLEGEGDEESEHGDAKDKDQNRKSKGTQKMMRGLGTQLDFSRLSRG